MGKTQLLLVILFFIQNCMIRDIELSRSDFVPTERSYRSGCNTDDDCDHGLYCKVGKCRCEFGAWSIITNACGFLNIFKSK